MSLPPHLLNFPSGVHDNSVLGGGTLLVTAEEPEESVAVIFGDELPTSMEAAPADGLRELVGQCALACDAGLYYAALFTALAVPSVCGALGASDGKGTGSNYRAWLVASMQGYDADRARRIYRLRCSLLHEGSSLPHRELIPVAFIEPFEPGVPQLHGPRTVVRGDEIEWLSIPIFIAELRDGVDRWLAGFGGSATVKRNFQKFAHRRPAGLHPHVLGTPVIA